MTCLASASALVDAFVESGSFLRPQVSACDFGVIDVGGGACGIIIHPGVTSVNAALGYGGVSLDRWGYVVNGFIRLTQNPVVDLGRVYQMHDVIKTVLAGASKVNNVARTILDFSLSFDPNVTWSLGGADWLLVRATVSVEEDPG